MSRVSSINKLEIFEIHNWKDPLLPFINHFNSQANDYFEGGNWHDSLEILWILEGKGEVLCDSRKYKAEKGDIFIINSQELHNVSSNEKIIYHCFIIGADFLSKNGIDISQIRYETKFSDKKFEDLFTHLVEEYESLDGKPDIPAVRAAALTLAAYLGKHHRADDKSSREKGHSDIIRNGLSYINSNFTAPLTLDEISSNIGISKYHFLREFKRYTGLTPVNYINALRCRYAKSLFINTELSIGETADECGYKNLSYFTEIFKKHVGVTPSAYCAKNRKSKEADA